MRTIRLKQASTQRLKSRLSLLRTSLFHIVREELFSDDDVLYERYMKMKIEKLTIENILLERHKNGQAG